MQEAVRPTATESGLNPSGLSPDLRSVYAALLEGTGDLADVRGRVGAGVDIEAAVELLTRLRLIHRTAGEDRFIAVSPTEAAEEVVGPREAAAYEALKEAADLRRGLRDLAPLYRAATRTTQALASSEILRSSKEVNDRLNELLPGVRRSVCSAHPTVGSPEILEASLESDRALVLRGIQCRSLFTHTARRYHQSIGYLRDVEGLGGQVRTAALIPTRMILLDHDYAVLPVNTGDAVAAVVRDSPVIAYLQEFFDYLWERGQPLTGEQQSDDRVPQEVEVAILHELAEGRTDEAISRRLGISSRTLRRYLAAMLDTFGVETRFQLGMAAVRQGLIAGDEGDGEGG